MSDVEYALSGFAFPFAWPPPREGAGGPCWCNGPYAVEAHHHEWCRKNRTLLRQLLQAGAEPHGHVVVAQALLLTAVEQLEELKADYAANLIEAENRVGERQRALEVAACRAVTVRLEKAE